MLVYRKIKLLIEQRRITNKELADAIEVTENGLHKMLSNEAMKLVTLEKIANFFNVPIKYFFEEGDVNLCEEPEVKYENTLLNKYIKALEELNELRKKMGDTDEENNV